MAKQSRKPVAELHMGRIKAIIWCNDTANGPRYNVTFAKLFKKDDQWQETQSFGRDDLPLVQKLADRAHDYIYQQSTRGNFSVENE